MACTGHGFRREIYACSADAHTRPRPHPRKAFPTPAHGHNPLNFIILPSVDREHDGHYKESHEQLRRRRHGLKLFRRDTHVLL